MKKILFLLLVSTLAACSTDDDDSTPLSEDKLAIPAFAKDHTFFKEGSYWIYENDKTHELDCVYVYQTTHIPADYERGTTEKFEVRSHSTYDNYDYYDKVNDAWINTPNRPVIRVKTSPGHYIGETGLFFFKPIIGTKGYPGSYAFVELLSIHDSLKVSQKNYENVVQIYCNRNLLHDVDETNYYFAPNIGIVKKENLTSNYSWNLVRYNVKQ